MIVKWAKDRKRDVTEEKALMSVACIKRCSKCEEEARRTSGPTKAARSCIRAFRAKLKLMVKESKPR
jgi:hypothetical protein